MNVIIPQQKHNWGRIKGTHVLIEPDYISICKPTQCYSPISENIQLSHLLHQVGKVDFDLPCEGPFYFIHIALHHAYCLWYMRGLLSLFLILILTGILYVLSWLSMELVPAICQMIAIIRGLWYISHWSDIKHIHIPYTCTRLLTRDRFLTSPCTRTWFNRMAILLDHCTPTDCQYSCNNMLILPRGSHQRY